MRKLDIVIPRYQEEASVLLTLLQSIQLQAGINFADIKVIVVEDGSKEPLTQDFINQFKFAVSVLHLDENKGVSNARNVGLLNAEAEYVMFCDADDSFHVMNALNIVFNNMAQPADIYTYAFLSEAVVSDRFVYMPNTNNNTFIHGKIFKRQFLIDNKIFFNPLLKVHEDGYFNVLANSYTKNRKNCNEIIYLWRHNPASVTRRDSTFLARTLKDFVVSSIALMARLEGKEEKDVAFITNSVIHNILYLYVQSQLPYWNGQDEHKALFEQYVGYYVQHFHHYYEAADASLKQTYWINEITSGLKQGYPSTAENFNLWLDRMLKIEVK